VDLAEIGIEQAMACFYTQSTGTASATAWSGWTLSGSTATRTFSGFTPAPNTTAAVRVYVNYYTYTGGTPVIVAKATVTPPDGPTLDKFVEITLTNRSLFSSGLVARNSISWVGHPSADSWDSDPDQNAATAAVGYSSGVRNANCTVGCVNGSITLGSGGDVYGYAKTGASGTTTGGSVHGTGTTVNDTSRITTDFSATFQTITVPSPSYTNTIASGSVPTDFPRSTDTAASDSKYYYNFAAGAAISTTTTIGTAVPNKSVIFIMNSHSGTTVIGFTGSRDLTIRSGSNLTVYTNGDIDAHGNGVVNSGGQASAFQIYGTATTAGGQSITVGGNGQLYAAVYAPNATVTLQGGGSSGQVLGSIVANTISMNGGTDFHYDEALARLTTATGVSVSKWKELQSSTERSTYATQLNF